MTCERYPHLDAGYVLGALSPAERREFEQHLGTCESCDRAVRELAGLPGLLSRLQATEVADLHPVAPMPRGLLASVLAAAGRERRRRRLATAGASVVAAVLLVTGTALVTDALDDGGGPADGAAGATADPEPAGAVMTPVDQDRLSAELGLEEVAWGTRIQLRCRYSGTPESVAGLPAYVLVLRTRDGGVEHVASWRAVAGKTATITAATASSAADIASVDVETDSGRVLLHLER